MENPAGCPEGQVGDHETLIDEILVGYREIAGSEASIQGQTPIKRDNVIAMLRRPEGVTIDDMTSRKAGSARGAIPAVSGMLSACNEHSS